LFVGGVVFIKEIRLASAANYRGNFNPDQPFKGMLTLSIGENNKMILTDFGGYKRYSINQLENNINSR
jgi:hypothetical protein